jgi:preprotein translocase subunit YajC
MNYRAIMGLPLFVGMVVASPATAQTAAAPATAASPAASVGMTVKDPAGGTVGTVTAVESGFVTVKTDKHVAKLPSASFRAEAGGLVYGATQAQLNSDIETQLAAAQAQFKTGATVRGAAGTEVGTVTALDADYITLKLTSGKSVRLPRNAVAPGTDGLVLGMTAAQLEAAVGSADGAATSDTAAPAAATTSTTTKTTTTKKSSSKAKK